MFGGGIAVRILAGLLFVACIFTFGASVGYRFNDSKWQAKENARLTAEQKAKDADFERAQAVVGAYEAVRAELRRITAVNRVEIVRETQKIEYRCPVPDDGERLRHDAIRAANSAAGFPDAAVPADPVPEGARPGRPANSVFGADGDVR